MIDLQEIAPGRFWDSDAIHVLGCLNCHRGLGVDFGKAVAILVGLHQVLHLYMSPVLIGLGIIRLDGLNLAGIDGGVETGLWKHS